MYMLVPLGKVVVSAVRKAPAISMTVAKGSSRPDSYRSALFLLVS